MLACGRPQGSVHPSAHRCPHLTNPLPPSADVFYGSPFPSSGEYHLHAIPSIDHSTITLPTMTLILTSHKFIYLFIDPCILSTYLVYNFLDDYHRLADSDPGCSALVLCGSSITCHR